MKNEQFDSIIDEVAGAMTAGEPRPGFTAEVMARIESGDAPRRTWRAAWVLAPLAAAAIVLALVRPFSVLLVDEPFVGLDPAGQDALAELLTAAADAGCAVMVATHQLAFLERATRCVALRDGTVAYRGPVDRAKIDPLLD